MESSVLISQESNLINGSSERFLPMGLAFTNEETELLLHLYDEKQDILRNRDKSIEAKTKRAEAWKEIHRQIVIQTGKNFSIQQCKKRYNNKKQALREKIITARLNISRNWGEPSTSELISGTDLFFNHDRSNLMFSGIHSDTSNIDLKKEIELPSTVNLKPTVLKPEPDVSNSCLKRKLVEDFESSSEDNAWVKSDTATKVQRKTVGESYPEPRSNAKDSGIPLSDLKRQVLLRQLDLIDKQEEVLQKMSTAADSIVAIKNAVELASAAIFEHYQQTE